MEPLPETFFVEKATQLAKTDPTNYPEDTGPQLGAVFMQSIHGICLVKDEKDVIEQCLNAAKTWCDYIYVYDNGSSDGTWEIIQALARGNSTIIPFKQQTCPFSNNLRGDVYRQYSSAATKGDWWCILDADEFYIDDPRTFLAKIPCYYDRVWSASFQYYFTDIDLQQYEQQPQLYADDVPVEEKLRYYINNWSEMRFFRQNEGTVWHPDRSQPVAQGAVYPVRIWLKHYQYRSPEQIQKRLVIRTGARRPFVHEAQKNWKATVIDTSLTSHDTVINVNAQPSWIDRIMPASCLDCDDGHRKYVVREDLMPPLPVNPTMELKVQMSALRSAIAARCRKIIKGKQKHDG